MTDKTLTQSLLWLLRLIWFITQDASMTDKTWLILKTHGAAITVKT